jgi:aldehyde:ferredoxin oxidoreductase
LYRSSGRQAELRDAAALMGKKTAEVDEIIRGAGYKKVEILRHGPSAERGSFSSRE